VTPAPKTQSEFPQWAHDLRRFDIILFGSFPFTYWYASIGMDIHRSSQHNWDARYAPWPFKSAGAINMTKDEYALTITCAVAGSVVIALVDYIIVKIKRNRAARAAAALPQGEVIIIRNPKTGGDAPPGDAPDGGSGGADAAPETPPAEASPDALPEAQSPPAPTEAD
jgi:hypothetical protein